MYRLLKVLFDYQLFDKIHQKVFVYDLPHQDRLLTVEVWGKTPDDTVLKEPFY